MKIIIESLEVVVDDIYECVAKLIHCDKMKGVLELIAPKHKQSLT